MRALVKYGCKPGELEIRDVPVPEIGPEDVLLQVKAVGICGWDVEMWQHTMANPVTVPVIQGHEFCGVIERVGERVSGFAAGDRVVSETSAVVCGACAECHSGNYHLCSQRKGFGYGVDGAFTDFVKVRQGCLHHLPEHVDFDHAALTEPACVAYQALVSLSRITPGMPIFIIGPGPMGLMSVQVARACGAGPIYICGTGRSPARLKAARDLGADVVIDGSQDDPLTVIMDASNGRGMPLVIDSVGISQTLKLAIDTVARRGQITKIGWGPKPLNISLDPLLSKAASIQGTFSHNWPTWEAVIKLISDGVLDMETMITHRITLDQWLETFEAIEHGEVVKAVVQFNR